MVANGPMYAPENSMRLFVYDGSALLVGTKYLNNCTSITFNNKFNVNYATAMQAMFAGCSSLTSLDLSNWSCTLNTYTTSMFENCSSLQSINLTNFATNSVTNMGTMFAGCSALQTLDLSSFNMSNVTYMPQMFGDCSSLTTISFPNNFLTSKCTSAYALFERCSSLTNVDTSDWNWGGCDYSTWRVFNGCSSLVNFTLSGSGGSSIQVLDQWFINCTSLETFSCTLNLSGLTSSMQVFYGCTSLKSIYLNNTLNTSISLTDSGVNGAWYKREYWGSDYEWTQYSTAKNWGQYIKASPGVVTFDSNCSSMSGAGASFVVEVLRIDAQGAISTSTYNIKANAGQTITDAVAVRLTASADSYYVEIWVGTERHEMYGYGSGGLSRSYFTYYGNIRITKEWDVQSCILANSLVLMADGTYKQLGDIRVGDEILSYDFDTGKLIANPVIYASSEDDTMNWNIFRYYRRTFSDGTVIENAFAHRFYNVTQQAFVYLEFWNIGDEILKQDGTTASLVSVERIVEDCTFGRITGLYGTNYFANGCLTGDRHCPANLDLLMLEYFGEYNPN